MSGEDPHGSCLARADSVRTQTKKDLPDSTTQKRAFADLPYPPLSESELEDDSKLDVNVQEHKLYFDCVNAEREWWGWYDLRGGAAGWLPATLLTRAVLAWILAGTRVAVRGLELRRTLSDVQREFETASESAWAKRAIRHTLLVWKDLASTFGLQPALFIVGSGSPEPSSDESWKAPGAKQKHPSESPVTALGTCQGLQLEEYLDILSRCSNLVKTMDARYRTSGTSIEGDEVIIRILVPVVRQTVQLFTGQSLGFPGSFHEFDGCNFSLRSESEDTAHEAMGYQSRLAKIRGWLLNSIDSAISDAKGANVSRRMATGEHAKN